MCRSTRKASIRQEQAPAVIHQAIAAAYVGRGVAHLTLPQDVILAETNCGVASMDTLRSWERAS